MSFKMGESAVRSTLPSTSFPVLIVLTLALPCLPAQFDEYEPAPRDPAGDRNYMRARLQLRADDNCVGRKITRKKANACSHAHALC